MNVYRIAEILRKKGEEELIHIMDSPKTRTNFDKEILPFLNTLKCKKNLLYLYPYQLFFDEDLKFDEAVEVIKNYFQNDFKNAIKLRETFAPDYETYFSLFFDNYICIYKWDKLQLFYVDRIETKTSEIFMELSERY